VLAARTGGSVTCKIQHRRNGLWRPQWCHAKLSGSASERHKIVKHEEHVAVGIAEALCKMKCAKRQ
jgi:hypothetical protein